MVPVVSGRLGEPQLVAYGDCSGDIIPPSCVFRAGISAAADQVVLVHNHPAGGPPSVEDHAVTRRLTAAGALLGIPLLVHLVITEGCWLECDGTLQR